MKNPVADIPNLMTPLRHVRAAVPKLGRLVDKCREHHKQLWPESCFVPVEFWVDLGLMGDDVDIVDAMCRWQLGKGVYRIDPDVYEALVQTPTGKVPVEVFDHLPEWCVFIPTPSMDGPGFWVHPAWSHQFGKALTFTLLAHDGSIDGIFALPLKSGLTLDEAVRDAVKDCYLHRVEQFITSYAAQNGVFAMQFGSAELEEQTQRWLPLIAARLPLVIYLCSANRDITAPEGGQPKKRRAKKTKKRGKRLFSAAQPKVWDVGTRIGAKLRQARKRAASAGSTGNGASKRPHLRRAHWHSYWTGPLSGPRKLIVKWLPPISVKVDLDDPNTPTTVREVEPRRLRDVRTVPHSGDDRGRDVPVRGL